MPSSLGKIENVWLKNTREKKEIKIVLGSQVLSDEEMDGILERSRDCLDGDLNMDGKLV